MVTGDSFDRKLAEKVKGIDVIVGGHSQALLTKPLKVKGRIVYQHIGFEDGTMEEVGAQIKDMVGSE